MQKLIPIETILERDLDLLIIEEFNCNNDFVKWFLKKIGYSPDFKSVNSIHSLMMSGFGESDIITNVEYPNGTKLMIMIENKIDAEFMKQQDLRYKQRGNEYVSRGECNEFKTVLISPENYGKGKDFDIYINYGELYEYFMKLGDIRSTYKAENIIMGAIERRRRGYTGIKNEKTTDFRQMYRQYLSENAPELGMQRPDQNKRKESFFILFKGFSKQGIFLRQKLRPKHSSIDLEFKS